MNNGNSSSQFIFDSETIKSIEKLVNSISPETKELVLSIQSQFDFGTETTKSLQTLANNISPETKELVSAIQQAIPFDPETIQTLNEIANSVLLEFQELKTKFPNEIFTLSNIQPNISIAEYQDFLKNNFQSFKINTHQRNDLAQSFENISEIFKNHVDVSSSNFGTIDNKPIDEPNNVKNGKQKQPECFKEDIETLPPNNAVAVSKMFKHTASLLRNPEYIGEKLADIIVENIITAITYIGLMIVHNQIDLLFGLAIISTLLSVFQPKTNIIDKEKK